VDSLTASATLRWSGFHGHIDGASGALAVDTATQSELGGPGGESNPEELFAAAIANCFTSTLTSMARSRGIALGEVSTSASSRLSWGEGAEHHLSEVVMHTQVASAAPESEVRALIAAAEAHCPICQAVAGRVELQLTADVIGV
jgi:lipoyl-dependent peroxiredoxin